MMALDSSSCCTISSVTNSEVSPHNVTTTWMLLVVEFISQVFYSYLLFYDCSLLSWISIHLLRVIFSFVTISIAFSMLVSYARTSASNEIVSSIDFISFPFACLYSFLITILSYYSYKLSVHRYRHMQLNNPITQIYVLKSAIVFALFLSRCERCQLDHVTVVH